MQHVGRPWLRPKLGLSQPRLGEFESAANLHAYTNAPITWRLRGSLELGWVARFHDCTHALSSGAWSTVPLRRDRLVRHSSPLRRTETVARDRRLRLGWVALSERVRRRLTGERWVSAHWCGSTCLASGNLHSNQTAVTKRSPTGCRRGVD